MAFSFRDNSSRGSVGLDIDGRFLAAVEASGRRIERAASAELPAGLVHDGEVADRDGLTAALKHFFKQHHLPKTVRLGVANQQIVVRQVELPRIEDQKELDAAVRFQAAEAIAMPLDEAVLDHQVAAQTVDAQSGARMQVMVVAARQSMVADFVAAVRGAGLKPEGIDLNAFALVRTLAGDAVAEGNARVFCHLAGVTNLAIAMGSSCLFTRPLRAGWDAEDAAATASGLADEIRLSIDYYMAQPQARPVGEVLLSGPGAQREGLGTELESLLGLPVSVPEPLGTFEASTLPIDEDPYRHTVAAGLATGTGA